MHFLAQAPLGADAEAIGDEPRPDHQFRIDRGTAHFAVERALMRADLR